MTEFFGRPELKVVHNTAKDPGDNREPRFQLSTVAGSDGHNSEGLAVQLWMVTMLAPVADGGYARVGTAKALLYPDARMNPNFVPDVRASTHPLAPVALLLGEHGGSSLTVGAPDARLFPPIRVMDPDAHVISDDALVVGLFSVDPAHAGGDLPSRAVEAILSTIGRTAGFVAVQPQDGNAECDLQYWGGHGFTAHGDAHVLVRVGTQ
jgi:hypothetical protein